MAVEEAALRFGNPLTFCKQLHSSIALSSPTSVKAPSHTPHPDPQLRELLLSFYLDTFTGEDLAGWLRDLGEDPRGTVAEKQQRIREHTKYLSMPAEEFPRQTEHYLQPYDSQYLGELCEALNLSTDGSKEARYRRILREVRYREGWMTRIAGGARPTIADIVPVLGWVPIVKRADYEKDYCVVFGDELREVFGDDLVYEQLPVAHGSTLRIDFHVGDPQGDGVGIEVKMPTNNSDVQRALGQLDQYKRRYKDELVLLVVADLLKPELLKFFQTELESKQVSMIVR